MRGLSTAEELATVYTAVVKSALDAVIIVDETGRVVSLNAAAVAMFGYGEEEAVGEDIARLIVPPHLRSAHAAGMERYRATGEQRVLGRPVEMQGMRKDGSLIPVELAIQEVSVDAERYFTANLRDLSAAHRDASEIERQRDALHQTEKLAALGSLLAGVAHELNNPLSIVLGQATMLLEEARDAGDERLFGRADKIEKAADRCARIVRSFLSIARQRKPERKPVEVEPLIEACIELVGYTLKSSGIEIERRFADPGHTVFADPDQLQQIVVNLLVNASQALEARADGRRVRISVREGPAGEIVLQVSDNGPGVPPEICPRIFDPFFTTKPQGMGTGIGLSVSRGLAEAQGGRLELAASDDEGAAFELWMPGIPSGAEIEPAGTAREAPGGKSRSASILVVDDEPDIVELVQESLQGAGFRCDTALNGAQAKEKVLARDGAFDAVVCDLRMPDVDGASFGRWVAETYPALSRRFVFITGDALTAPRAGLPSGHGEILEKPFRPADIVAAVDHLVARLK